MQRASTHARVRRLVIAFAAKRRQIVIPRETFRGCLQVIAYALPREIEVRYRTLEGVARRDARGQRRRLLGRVAKSLGWDRRQARRNVQRIRQSQLSPGRRAESRRRASRTQG